MIFLPQRHREQGGMIIVGKMNNIQFSIFNIKFKGFLWFF